MFRFREMCETESSLAALQYLQQEVSAVVNHNDDEESAAFQRLLSVLLSRPMSPISPTAPQLPLPHPTDNTHLRQLNGTSYDADVEMQDEAFVSAPSTAITSPVTFMYTSPQLHAQRLAAFDQLLEFIDPRAKQPKTDIMDLVRSEL